MLFEDDSFHLFYNVQMLECYISIFVNVRFYKGGETMRVKVRSV